MASGSDNRVKIDESNNGIVNTGTIGTLNVYTRPPGGVAMLSSLLSEIVTTLSVAASTQKLVEINLELPPKISLKIEHNQLNRNKSIINDFLCYGHMLEASLVSAEKYNPNIRFFLYKNIGEEYQLIRDNLFSTQTEYSDVLKFVQKNADLIIDVLINKLLKEFKTDNKKTIYVETTKFALGLAIADSIMECKTLEKPEHAITS